MASFCPTPPPPPVLKRIPRARVCAERVGGRGEERRELGRAAAEVLNAARDLAGRFPRPAAKCRREKLHRDNYRDPVIGARLVPLLEQENRSWHLVFCLSVSVTRLCSLISPKIFTSFLILISLFLSRLFSSVISDEFTTSQTKSVVCEIRLWIDMGTDIIS